NKDSTIIPEDKCLVDTPKNHSEKFCRKRVSITEVLKSYYDLGVPNKDEEGQKVTEDDQKRVDEFKRIIKYSHEPKNLKRQKIANKEVNSNGAETPEKDYERPIKTKL
ncbi:6482_t:CDS:2, partial [Gigaspora margarita]